MKKAMVNELKAGQWVTSFFSVRSVVKKKSKNNKDYIVFELADRSGEIKGYLWNSLETGSRINPGCFVKVNGYVKSLNGLDLIQVKQIWLAPKAEICLSDFVDSIENVSEEHRKRIKDQHCPNRTGDLFRDFQN